MRLGPALLVVLLPLIARADYTSTSNEDDTKQILSANSSNSVSLHLSKPNSSTSSKSSTSTNTIPPDKTIKFIQKDLSKSNLTFYHDIKDGINGKYNKEETLIKHSIKPYTREKLQADSYKRIELSYKKKNLTIGYLTAVKGDLKERQGLSVSGALTMALKEVICLLFSSFFVSINYNDLMINYLFNELSCR